MIVKTQSSKGNVAWMTSTLYSVVSPYTGKINTASICAISNLIWSTCTHKVNIAMLSTSTLYNIRQARASKFNIAILYLVNHPIWYTNAFKCNIPWMTRTINFIRCCPTIKTNIARLPSMIQTHRTSSTINGHIAITTLIDIHKASSTMNT